jgi:hypothetical protein
MVLVMFVSAVGCGRGPKGVEIGKVKGTVTLNHQPLADATVLFQPASGRPSYGKTDSAGKYTLEYTQGIEGAVVGKHKVIIRSEVPGEDGKPPLAPEKLPNKYHDKSELSAEVKSGPNTFDFDLSSK